jgi:hypothetical protein
LLGLSLVVGCAGQTNAAGTTAENAQLPEVPVAHWLPSDAPIRAHVDLDGLRRQGFGRDFIARLEHAANDDGELSESDWAMFRRLFAGSHFLEASVFLGESDDDTQFVVSMQMDEDAVTALRFAFSAEADPKAVQGQPAFDIEEATWFFPARTQLVVCSKARADAAALHPSLRKKSRAPVTLPSGLVSVVLTVEPAMRKAMMESVLEGSEGDPGAAFIFRPLVEGLSKVALVLDAEGDGAKLSAKLEFTTEGSAATAGLLLGALLASAQEEAQAGSFGSTFARAAQSRVQGSVVEVAARLDDDSMRALVAHLLAADDVAHTL